MILRRTLEGAIRKALRSFPAVLVTGPRQSGKTTLLRTGWGRSHRYVSLENPDVRERARVDPNGFLADHPPPVILDEIQYAPDLLPYVKTAIDEDRRPGRWLLSGSQVFPLMQGVGESLAGRAAVMTLLGLSSAEAARRPAPDLSPSVLLRRALAARRAPAWRRIPLGRWILRGGYPELWKGGGADREIWAASYVQTYLERDVRTLLRVGDLGAFQVFLRLVAARTGQVLNLSDLGRDAGVTHPTARTWLSVLEASHQVMLLRPYHRSLGKRLIKAPKVYMLDTGIACYLMGLRDPEAVMAGPAAGALFETAVVAEWAKAFLHRGLPPPLWYWRARDGREIDLLVEDGGRLHPIEIKATATPRPSHAEPILRWRREAKAAAGDGLVVANVSRPSALAAGVRVLPWDAIA